MTVLNLLSMKLNEMGEQAVCRNWIQLNYYYLGWEELY